MEGKVIILGNGVYPIYAADCALCAAGHSNNCSCSFNCGHQMCYHHDWPVGENKDTIKKKRKNASAAALAKGEDSTQGSQQTAAA